MYYRYSTALSHIFLSFVGVYCLRSYTAQNHNAGYHPIFSYLIVLTNSLSGIWKWGNPANGYTSNTIYSHTRLLQTIFTFPLIVTELWMKSNSCWLIAYVHIACSLLIWTCYYFRAYRDKFVDIVIALNILSCFIVSINMENFYGMSLGLSYGINHFVLREGCEIFEMPTIDFYNYALCFFLPFSLKALQA